MKDRIVKKIKIEERNVDKIKELLDLVNGKMRPLGHRYLTYPEIMQAVREAENRLTLLPKRLWKGVCLYPNGGWVSSRSYKYQFTTVTARVERCATGWFLTSVQREQHFPCPLPPKMFVPEEVEAEIKNKLFEHFVS